MSAIGPIQPTSKLANTPWHLYLVGLGIVAMTVYLVAQANDDFAWAYVIILLLGLVLASAEFQPELQKTLG